MVKILFLLRCLYLRGDQSDEKTVLVVFQFLPENQSEETGHPEVLPEGAGQKVRILATGPGLVTVRLTCARSEKTNPASRYRPGDGTFSSDMIPRL